MRIVKIIRWGYYDPSGYCGSLCDKKYSDTQGKGSDTATPTYDNAQNRSVDNQPPRPTANVPNERNYVLFNESHQNSAPVPKGIGPNSGRLQSHHGLQQQWARENLSIYGYNPDLAPTVTIETGRGLPHTNISNAQNTRRDARVASGQGKWSSSLQDELNYIVDDFRNAGFSRCTIESVLEQQYKMLDKLGVSYERIVIR